jgi:hypothetical protein
MEHKLSGWNSEKNRAGEIRTRDLLNPIQAHYQAVLRPDFAGTIRRPPTLAKPFPFGAALLAVTCRRRDRTTKLCYGPL